jgi:hypothetical protein
VVVQVTANTGQTKEATFIDGLHLKAAAQFNTRTQAGPEPAKKGKKINVAGQLVVVSYKQNGWTGFVGQPLKVQLKARGGKYKTVKTGEYGYAQTSTATSAIAKSDYVKVTT